LYKDIPLWKNGSVSPWHMIYIIHVHVRTRYEQEYSLAFKPIYILWKKIISKKKKKKKL